jgi:hypothetical protein
LPLELRDALRGELLLLLGSGGAAAVGGAGSA